MTGRAAWLAQVEEAALEPGLPICDTHHHLWDRRPHAAPDERYLIDELVAEFGGHNVVSTVFNECRAMYRRSGPEALRPVGETEFVNGVAAMAESGLYGPCRVAAGIVGWADLRLGARVEEVLAAHVAASPRFRGVRFPTFFHESPAIKAGRANEPAPGALLEKRVHEALVCLARHGISFEAAVFHTQLDEVVQMARAHPRLTVVVGHLGTPVLNGPYAGRTEEVFQAWKASIAELARCDNVVLKLGGLANPRYGFGWQNEKRPPTSEEFANATARWLRFCIEAFTPRRCMFESNFPVDKASISYVVLWNAYKRLTRDLSHDERADLFHRTAERVYRLEAAHG